MDGESGASVGIAQDIENISYLVKVVLVYSLKKSG